MTVSGGTWKTRHAVPPGGGSRTMVPCRGSTTASMPCAGSVTHTSAHASPPKASPSERNVERPWSSTPVTTLRTLMCAILAHMKIGIFVSETSAELTDIPSLVANAAAAEAAGFTTAWVPHIPWSLDALTAVTIAAGATERIELGTAVVPTYSRHPLAMAQQALSTQAAAGGRLALGIGPSHQMVIEGMYGLSYEHPIAHMREYVDVLDSAFAGAGQVDHDGDLYSVHAMLNVPGAQSAPVLLSALAPLMLRLAGERADGTITWMCDDRAMSEHVVPRISAAAETAGRPA